MHDFNGMEKIKNILEIKNLNLPMPETVFVFDLRKQEKEIEEFINGKEFVMIRSDKKGNRNNCPHNLKCHANNAKSFIEKLNKEGFVAILQEHVPFNAFFSGNVLLLKNKIIIEVMEGSPLTLMNRYGKVDEHLQIERFTRKEIKHYGKRVLTRNIFEKILNLVEYLPIENKILEFAVGPDWFYFWEIRDDKTGKMLK